MQPDENGRTPDQREDGPEERRDNQAPEWQPDPQAGVDREVGDLEDPDAQEDGALPGRAGGGLAGG